MLKKEIVGGVASKLGRLAKIFGIQQQLLWEGFWCNQIG